MNLPEYEVEMKQIQAINQLLNDCNKSQAETIRQLKNTLITVCICFCLIICTMVAGFFWYEGQYDTTESTTTTISTSGENANVNTVTDGNMYNDSATHNEY